MTLRDARALEQLLDVAGPSRTTPINELKKVAGRASWSAFREQVSHMAWVDSLGDTSVWLQAIAESKIADLAREPWAADAAVMGDVTPLKRTALLTCVVLVARQRVRDDLAAMFCKRIASITKRAKTELEEIRARQQELSERPSSTTATCSPTLTPAAQPGRRAVTSRRACSPTCRTPYAPGDVAVKGSQVFAN